MAFDIPQIMREVEDAPEAPPGPWLAESWSDPDGFMQAVARHQATLISPAAKSRLGAGIDLCHDLVLRHLPSDRVALRWFDRRHGWQALTFTELEKRSAARARAWAGHGVKSGDILGLVYAVGPELAVSLVAALRLGAVIAFVPPLGVGWVTHRLAAVKPDRIATEGLYLPFLRDMAELVLPQEGTSLAPVLRHASEAYLPGTPLALLGAPLDDSDAPPATVPGEAVWLGALRDALFCFALRPGDNFAAPGFDVEQHQPALLFAAWVQGAAYVHLEPDDLARDPSLLFEFPLKSVGITTITRDLLLKAGLKPGRHWGHWFRNPEEPYEAEPWDQFLKQLGLKTVAHSNVIVDAAAGGVVLTSQRVRGRVNTELLPAPGRAWCLIDGGGTGPVGPLADGAGPEALNDAGVFVPGGEDADREGYAVLTRAGEGFRYAGTVSPRRAGRTYPSVQVCAAIADLPFVRGSLVVPQPTAGRMQQWYFALVVFTGGEEAAIASKAAGERQDAIHRRLLFELGPSFVPDRVELFSLYPRKVDGELDEDWCRAQYMTGALHLKTRDPGFKLLTRLRALCEADSAPTRTGPV